MWGLPHPGNEPKSPALTSRFLTTRPPGKPSDTKLQIHKLLEQVAEMPQTYTSAYDFEETENERLKKKKKERKPEKKSKVKKVLVAQSYLTLCDPINCSLPGSSAHGILQARILVCIAMPFSRGSSRPRD